MKSIIHLTFAFLLLSLKSSGQSTDWSISLSLGMILPYGEFEVIRPNGKTVQTDIESGFGFQLGVCKQLNAKWSLEVGTGFGSKHSFSIVQNFPDGSDFAAADRLKPTFLYIKGNYKVLNKKAIQVGMALNLGYVLFNDIVLPSAGPPYDRVAPLVIDSKNKWGMGLGVNTLKKINQRLSAKAALDLFINRYQGVFATEDDADPFSDIDLGFNPIRMSVGLLYHL